MLPITPALTYRYWPIDLMRATMGNKVQPGVSETGKFYVRKLSLWTIFRIVAFCDLAPGTFTHALLVQLALQSVVFLVTEVLLII